MTIDFGSDLTYLGVWTMLYTTMEPCAYFVCSCLPGTRPLARAVYHKSGLRDRLTSPQRKRKTASNRPLRDPFPVGQPYANHFATISTGVKDEFGGSLDKDMARFGYLEETLQLKSSRRTTPEAWDTGSPV